MSIVERQRKHVFFPWSAQAEASSIEIESAQGVYFNIIGGLKVLDFSSHVFNACLGHSHYKIKDALAEYAQRALVPLPNGIYEERALLGENLARITPDAQFTGLTKSFICLSGAEANENAIKMAQLVTGRTKVMTRYRSYHGATLSALQYSGDYRRMPFDGMVNGIVRIPDFCTSQARPESLELLEELILAEGPETIACMLLEGVVGANGVYLPIKNFWLQVRNLCDKYGIILIADEVMSGFGRTGKWFAVEHFGVTPDIMTLSKGLTAGYAPLGAVIVNEKIASYFDHNKLWCGLTHYAHPLSCTVANAVIKAIEEEHLVDNSFQRGQELARGLQTLKKEMSFITDVRSIGLLAAIDLGKSSVNSGPFAKHRTSASNYAAQKLQNAFLKNGLYCVVRFDTVLLAPPLIISAKEIEEGLSKIRKTLTQFFS